MADTEYNSVSPCAFCGLGEPSTSQSHSICPLCMQHLELHDDIVLLPDTELQRKIILIPITSKNIERAGWRNADGASGVLVIKFHGGRMFRYTNVPHAWWRAFLEAPSKGQYFHSTVRADATAYPFRQIH